ncbi:hypothetical protein ACFQ48_18245 [Hymenobacter caeli]|uniref:Right-handed parallel beta-helix repeat-containing protein n=1 Tax=Hymenobacter caeli TaxID=2735894 RepID=A0ABX2FSR2_9BACT|nr:hypothetical protein [Hymenobacter caeli]NRT19521.1 hypothetical protein [Hymenobacter caeli]
MRQFHSLFTPAAALLLATGALLSSCENLIYVAAPVSTVGQAFSGDTLRSPIKGTIAGRANPYYMIGDVTVNDGDTLLIQAGVKILVIGKPKSTATFGQATNNPGFVVNGVLLSLGTKAAPVVMTINDNLKGDPAAVVSAATDPAFKGYWGGINADGASLLVLRWTDIGYIGGPYGANAPTGYAAGDPKYGVSMLAKKANARLVMEDCYLHGSVDDFMRLQSCKFSLMRNRFEKTGKAGGEGVNVKAGCLGDIAYNTFVGGATNGSKVASVAAAPVQANVNTYNNTYLNCGYRQTKAGRGGSINYEVQAAGLVYNNLIANCRFGLRMRSDDQPDLSKIKYNNQYYYGATSYQVAEFNAATAGSVTANQPNDTRGTAGTNDPKFQAADLTTAAGTTAAPSTTIQWTNFLKGGGSLRLQAGSPALGKGFTTFSPVNAVGDLRVGGLFTPTVTPPGSDAGAYQADGTGNQQ